MANAIERTGLLRWGERGAQAVSARIGGALADITALKGVPVIQRIDGQLWVAGPPYSLYVFDADGTGTEALPDLVAPLVGPGRFRLVASAATNVSVVTKSFDFDDLQEADMDIDVDFDAALPTGVNLILGGGCNVTAVFDNVGDTADVTFDLGISGGDRDAFCDGGSLDTVAVSGGVSGAGVGTVVANITPSVNVLPSVNGDTLTKGAAVAYLAYVHLAD